MNKKQDFKYTRMMKIAQFDTKKPTVASFVEDYNAEIRNLLRPNPNTNYLNNIKWDPEQVELVPG